MTRTVIHRLIGCCGLWLLLSSLASAQYNPYPTYNPGARFAPYARNQGFTPSGQPRLSPYLNLLRGGNPAANYYLGVVPENERRRFEGQARNSIFDLERRPGTTAPAGEDDLFPKLSQTGHAVQYMNPAPYYNTGTGRPAGQQSPQMFRPQKR